MIEEELVARYGTVAGMDEVGRGSLAGPVCVGVVVIRSRSEAPDGLTDSKLLSVKKRNALYPQIQKWALAAKVGWASPQEIDAWGLTQALRAAGLRAFHSAVGALVARGLEAPGVVLLDGSHNWLLAEPATLWDAPEENIRVPLPPVVTKIKADLTCRAVSAASVIAKVERDGYMEGIPDPGYHWSSNKGYGSAEHRRAILRLGPSEHHRKTWNLFGAEDADQRRIGVG